MSEQETKTIYVVTSGWYSGYHIDAVFDDKAMAEEYRQRFHCEDIEEYKLNPAVRQLRQGLQPWLVEMCRDGSVQTVMMLDCKPCRDFELWPTRDYAEMHMWARDQQHAVKIANERRAMKIAMNEWPTRKDEWRHYKP